MDEWCGAAKALIADQPPVGARLLLKLREFHRLHHTPIERTIADMNEAYHWLPQSTHTSEAKPLIELVRKRTRGVTRIGELLIPLLIRLGVTDPEVVESSTSEARGSA